MQDLKTLENTVRQLVITTKNLNLRLQALEAEKPGLSRAASASEGPDVVCPKDSWENVKTRWPLFHMGRLSKEAYCRHYKTLGIEPAKETLLRYYSKLPQGRVLQWFEVQKYLETTKDIAGCYLWWLKTAGLLKSSKRPNHYEVACNGEKIL